MPITGTFVADFSSFTNAVTKAQYSLKGLEDDAGKVQKSLQKVGNSFSGVKMIQDANVLTQAINDLQKSAKDAGKTFGLTENEAKKVNAQLEEAIAKYTALGQTAPKAMTDLYESTKKVATAAPAMNNLADATKKIEQPASLAAKTFGDLGTQLKATALGFISAQAIMGAVSTGFQLLTGFVMGSIEAFAGSEKASKKLEAALLAQGNAAPALKDQYDALATQFEETTGNADDLITEMEALLVQVGDVAPDQMEAALQAATDLSAGLGKDLQETTLAVAKAFEGNTAALKKMIPDLDEAAIKAGDMSVAFEAVEKRFGGQAAAQMNTYAGAVKNLENAWDNLQEGVGEIIVKSPIMTGVLRDLNEVVKNLTVNSGNLTFGISSLHEQLGRPFGGGITEGLRWLEMYYADANKAAAAVKKLADEQEAARKKAEESAKPKPPPIDKGALAKAALPELKKEVDAVAAAVKGLDAAQRDFIATAKEAGKNTEFINSKLKIGEDVIDAYAKSLDAAKKSTAEHAKEAEKLAKALKEGVIKAFEDYNRANVLAQNETDRTGLEVTKFGKAIEFNQQTLLAWQRTMADGIPVIEGFGRELKNIGGGILTEEIAVDRSFLNGLDEAAKKAKAAADKTKEFTSTLKGLASALAGMSQIGGGFGDIAREMATLVSAFATTQESIDGFKKGLGDLGAAKTAKDTVGAFVEIGTSALTMASAFLQATETGTTLTKTLKGAALGAEIGGQFGAVGAAIGAGIGGLAGLLRGIFGKNEGRKMVEEFAKGLGGFDAIRDKLRAFGPEGERVWKQFTQGANSPAKAKAAIDAVNKALGDMPKRLNDIVGAAAKAGGGLDAAMVPYIEDLIEAGQLTEENANLLRGLPAAGVPSFNEVSQAAEALGLNIDLIGESVKQMKFEEGVNAVAANLDILQRAGADMDAVLNGVKGKLQDMVTEAMKTGKSLPESIKPFLQQLADSGKLTDIFGDKLTDLEDLHFTKPLEESVADLVTALHDLVDVIKNDVGGAFDELGRKVVHPTVAPRYEGMPDGAPDDGGNGSPPQFAGGTHGQFLDFGSGTPAILHGRERISTAGEGAGAGGTIVVQSILDGRVIAESIAKPLTEVVRRFGLVKT